MCLRPVSVSYTRLVVVFQDELGAAVGAQVAAVGVSSIGRKTRGCEDHSAIVGVGQCSGRSLRVTVISVCAFAVGY